MKTNHYLIFSTLVLLALAVAGCSDGENAVAVPGKKLTSIDQRLNLANPLKAEQGTAKRAARRPGSPPKSCASLLFGHRLQAFTRRPDRSTRRPCLVVGPHPSTVRSVSMPRNRPGADLL